jgi:hypothetical protein
MTATPPSRQGQMANTPRIERVLLDEEAFAPIGPHHYRPVIAISASRPRARRTPLVNGPDSEAEAAARDHRRGSTRQSSTLKTPHPGQISLASQTNAW